MESREIQTDVLSMACVLIQPASLLIRVENHNHLLDKQKQGSAKVKKKKNDPKLHSLLVLLMTECSF